MRLPVLPPVVRGLLIANIAIFLLELVSPDWLLTLLALWPLRTPYFHPWQVVTYAFLHEGIAHIAFNMLGLVIFGARLEPYWGSRRFTFYYVACVLSAAGTELVVQNAAGGGTPVVGASGGVYGLLLGYAWYFPRQEFLWLLPPIPIQAWLLATIYGAIELFLGVTGEQRSVAHFAHLGGMLGGVASILYWRARRRFSD